MQKYLRMSKKSSTFAAAFVKRHCDAPSGGSRFPRLTGTPPGYTLTLKVTLKTGS